MKKNKNKKIWSILLAITMIFTQGSTFAMAEEGTDAVVISENSVAENTQVFTDEGNVAAVTSEDLDADNVQTGDTAGSIDESEVEAQENVTESSTSELAADETQIFSESETLAASEEAEQILGDVEEQTDTEDWATMLISEDTEESESTHVHCVCGKATATEETHTHAPKTTWQALSGTISGTLESGNYYLSENVTVASGALIVEDTVNLCLNGYSLNAAEGSAVFTVEYGGSLSITDCQGSGMITGGSDSGIVNKGTFTFWNGSISNNTAYEGGGIYNCGVGGEDVSQYLLYKSTVIMYGGSITGNTANAGGGVFNDCGTVILYGGSIANNKAEDGGGVYNHCTYSTLGGNFEMLGGTITSNSASYQGGGVSNFFTFTMSGGSITNNTVYREKGLTVSANSGGVLNGGTLTLSGTVVITGNTLGGKTDNVCLYNYCEGDAGNHSYQITPTITAQNLTQEARIGVNAFTPVSNLTIVTGSVNTAVFTCDDNHYTLENNEANGLKLVSSHTPFWGNWIPNGNGTHTRTCTACGQTETMKCSGGTADCHTKATCTVCGGTYGEFDSTNHTGGTEVRDEKKATCKETGYTGDTYCLGCGAQISSGTIIPMAEHSWGGWTSNGDGTHTRTCSLCGDTETLNCSGGTADCHTKATCTVCEGTYGEFDKTNHTGGTEVRGEKEATCTQEGYTGDTYCLGCEEKITSGTTIPMNVHTWDAGTETTKPTCIEKGVRTYTCIVCKQTKTEEIPLDSTNHTGGTEVRGEKKATCKETGYTGDTYCLGCGAQISSGTIIPMAEHSWGGWTSNGDGTHTRTCSLCGDTETLDCSGGTADCHTKATCTVCGGTYGEFDKTNHIGGTEVRNKKEATCTETGYTGDTYCLGCKEKITSGTTIPMKAHTWDAGKETTKPTCTKKGVRTYTCTVCKKTKTADISATGHKYGSWITTSKATVFSPAIQTHTCSECKNKETRTTGKKLTPTIQVNATTVLLKVKQKTSAFKVTGLANGDSVTSYKSSNTKIFTVDSKKGIITAGKKTGSAKLTITLKSGTKKTVTVKVQKTVVKTTEITGLQTKVTMKKGAKLTLKPSRTPITSTQNFTYKTSNKKVATVSSKGVITAKKKGTVKITVKSGNVTKKVTVIVK